MYQNIKFEFEFQNQFVNRIDIHGGNSFESLNMMTGGINSSKPANSIGTRKTSIYQSAILGGTGISNWSNPGASGTSGTSSVMVGGLKSIQQLFLARGELSEINAKSIRQLTAAATLIGRLMRINMIEFKLDHLIAWLSLAINWPYYAALISIFVEEQHANLSPKVTLLQIYDQVMTRLSSMKDGMSSEIDLLQRDDRDLTKLDQYIRKEIGGSLTCGVLKNFMPWSPFMNPYFRTILRDYLINKNLSMSRGSRNQLISPPLSASQTNNNNNINNNINNNSNILTNYVMSEQSDVALEEDMPRSVTSPTNQLANQITSWSKTSFANLANKSDRPKTPIAIKRCMVKLKDGYPGKDLSQLDKYEIGILMSQIEGLSNDENITKYKDKLVSLNVTGLVLSVCDMDQLQLEMEMTFGDWQLFKTLINHLRAVEAFKSEEFVDLSQLHSDPNQIWAEADIEEAVDTDYDDEEQNTQQSCWPSYLRHSTNHSSKSGRKMKQSSASSATTNVKYKKSPAQMQQQQQQHKALVNSNKIVTTNIVSNNSAPVNNAPISTGPVITTGRKSSMGYNKAGYIYSPLATEENPTAMNIIPNNYSAMHEQDKPPVPSHRNLVGATPTATIPDSSSISKDQNNNGIHTNPAQLHNTTPKLVSATPHKRKSAKNSYRSLSHSQERIHLVRARTCPNNNPMQDASVPGRCATYIPVLLQASAMGGCFDYGALAAGLTPSQHGHAPGGSNPALMLEQECTCDYWFRIEHENGALGVGPGMCHNSKLITSSSEPASRSQSRPQTSLEASDYDDDDDDDVAAADESNDNNINNPRSSDYWPESVNKRSFNSGSAV